MKAGLVSILLIFDLLSRLLTVSSVLFSFHNGAFFLFDPIGVKISVLDGDQSLALVLLDVFALLFVVFFKGDTLGLRCLRLWLRFDIALSYELSSLRDELLVSVLVHQILGSADVVSSSSLFSGSVST